MHQGRPCVLVVEDDLLVAWDVKHLVAKCDCDIVGPVGSVGEALAAVRDSRLEGAVLDIDLDGERVWPVAELLEERGVPFILSTGCAEAEVPEHFRACPRISKPLTLPALGAALREVGTLRR